MHMEGVMLQELVLTMIMFISILCANNAQIGVTRNQTVKTFKSLFI